MYSLFTASNFIVRLLLSCALVFGTYNPSGRSYLHWVVDGDTDTLILKIFVGMALIAAYWLILVVSWLALDAVGLALLARWLCWHSAARYGSSACSRPTPGRFRWCC